MLQRHFEQSLEIKRLIKNEYFSEENISQIIHHQKRLRTTGWYNLQFLALNSNECWIEVQQMLKCQTKLQITTVWFWRPAVTFPEKLHNVKEWLWPLGVAAVSVWSMTCDFCLYLKRYMRRSAHRSTLSVCWCESVTGEILFNHTRRTPLWTLGLY